MLEKEPKAVYRRQLCYDDSFLPEFRLFLENIRKDNRFNNKNKRFNDERFSRAIRFLITIYNKKINKDKQLKEQENED